MADEFPQAQVLCKGGRQEQAGKYGLLVCVGESATSSPSLTASTVNYAATCLPSRNLMMQISAILEKS